MPGKKNIDPNLALILVGGVVGYFALVNPLLKYLGIKDSDEEKKNKAESETATKSNGWDTNYFKNNRGKGYLMMTESELNYVASEIYNSWGINDNEQRIFAAFRRIPDLFRLSQLVGHYASKYKQDLLTRLTNPWYYWNDGLDANEFAYIARLVNKMPNYTKS